MPAAIKNVLDFPLLPVESRVFETKLVAVCTFRCPAQHALFRDSGPSSVPTFVFPRTHTMIEPAGGAPFLGGPDRVSFYNRAQEYRRVQASAEGDHSDWFVIAPSALVDVVRRYDPRVVDHPDRPFPFAYGPSDARTYALQRRAFAAACEARSRRVDDPRGIAADAALHIEEMLLTALDLSVAAAFRAWHGAREARPMPPRAARDHRELAERARAILARRFQDSLSLGDIAREAGSSAYHLCRVFRAHAGTSLHQHRLQLRLRAALNQLEENRHNLTGLALDLGFSSHSHFTMAFRRAFGRAPRDYFA